MKIIEDSKSLFHASFSSVLDIKKYLLEKEDVGFSICRDESHSGSLSFTGTNNWDEFLDILDNGSDDIISKIKSEARKSCNLLNDKYSISHEYKLDVTGQFFDIGLVMSGEPETWLQPLEEDIKKQIEININASYLQNVNHSTVINNASRIIGMVLALEQMGVETKINLNFRSNQIYIRNSSKHFMVSLVAKEYEQGVDYKKLSSLLHTSMFRRGVFRMREVEVFDKMDSYGSTSARKGDTLIDEKSSIDKLELKLFGEKK